MKCTNAKELLMLVPLTSEELQYSRDNGVFALLDVFEKEGISPFFDFKRKSAI